MALLDQPAALPERRTKQALEAILARKPLTLADVEERVRARDALAKRQAKVDALRALR